MVGLAGETAKSAIIFCSLHQVDAFQAVCRRVEFRRSCRIRTARLIFEVNVEEKAAEVGVLAKGQDEPGVFAEVRTCAAGATSGGEFDGLIDISEDVPFNDESSVLCYRRSGMGDDVENLFRQARIRRWSNLRFTSAPGLCFQPVCTKHLP